MFRWLYVKIIDEKPWSWTLYEHDDEYFLSVMCGSVGLYSRDIILSVDETERYLTRGIDEIIKMAKIISFSPQKFKTRHIVGFHEKLAAIVTDEKPRNYFENKT